jgi:hypothetical protein
VNSSPRQSIAMNGENVELSRELAGRDWGYGRGDRALVVDEGGIMDAECSFWSISFSIVRDCYRRGNIPCNSDISRRNAHFLLSLKSRRHPYV